VFEYLLAGLKLPHGVRTSRSSPKCRPVVEALDDRTAPSVVGLHHAHWRLAAMHHHRHHHHRLLVQSPAVFIPVFPPAVPNVSVAAIPPPPNPSLTSGIQGQVRLGPLYPVSKPGLTNYRPLAGAKISITLMGAPIQAVTVVSDANGNFSAALPPGDYILTPLPLEPGQTLPHPPPPTTVHVSADAFTTVTITYDTGIR
jgi:hypothetical protein